jgi:hypothetical protein
MADCKLFPSNSWHFLSIETNGIVILTEDTKNQSYPSAIMLIVIA